MTQNQAKNKKCFAVNAISKQRTFSHLFTFSKWVKFFVKTIDLVFWAEVEKSKITPLLSAKNKTKQVIECKLDLRRNNRICWLFFQIIYNIRWHCYNLCLSVFMRLDTVLCWLIHGPYSSCKFNKLRREAHLSYLRTSDLKNFQAKYSQKLYRLNIFSPWAIPALVVIQDELYQS